MAAPMSLTTRKGKGLGRLELLAWLNSFVEADFTWDSLSDGVAYNQVTRQGSKRESKP
jgi:hypothetical protein